MQHLYQFPTYAVKPRFSAILQLQIQNHRKPQIYCENREATTIKT